MLAQRLTNNAEAIEQPGSPAFDLFIVAGETMLIILHRRGLKGVPHEAFIWSQRAMNFLNEL